MPTYDYVCTACDYRFEHFQKMSEAMLRKCPECSKRKLKRLMGTGAGIIFRGSGFYETDYKRAGRNGSGGGSGNGSTDSSAEGKPEKSDPKSDSGSNSGKDSGAGSNSKKPASGAAAAD